MLTCHILEYSYNYNAICQISLPPPKSAQTHRVAIWGSVIVDPSWSCTSDLNCTVHEDMLQDFPIRLPNRPIAWIITCRLILWSLNGWCFFGPRFAGSRQRHGGRRSAQLSAINHGDLWIFCNVKFMALKGMFKKCWWDLTGFNSIFDWHEFTINETWHGQ